jgi:hypothetical protein
LIVTKIATFRKFFIRKIATFRRFPAPKIATFPPSAFDRVKLNEPLQAANDSALDKKIDDGLAQVKADKGYEMSFEELGL